MSSKPILICILGPTAIGKTKLAIAVANHFSTEIISADSRQFYKEMTIGTAVPSKQELSSAPHHFIQNKSIFDNYSVGDFEMDSLITLDRLFKKKQILILVGGSGLYIDAVVKGLNKFPEVPVSIREALNEEFKNNGITSLQRELKEKDPIYYNKVDLKNHHRIIRALEICRGTNTSYSSFLNIKKEPRHFRTLFIGLTADRAIIYDRINQRVDMMIDEGLEHEARSLYANRSLNALQTVGYKEIFQYFDGKLSKKQAVEEVKKNSRRFAKRQLTWFNKNKEITWFDFKTNIKDITEHIQNTLEKS